ncbi:NUDIX domain-containing protein [Streptomyces sp. NPDC050400]|uniref:NUDIX hydrolase n=1 Tax=Streptomyces sp. NPDC050400 TaxID=3365610 RepID=UPI003790A446
MQQARVRVAVYVTRTGPEGRELLVFDHRDQPEAGTQVPAGGVDAGELLTEAALREIKEETGMAGVTLGAALAVQQRPHPHTGQPRITVFFHAETTESRDSWPHTVRSRDGDQDNGLAFRCYFIPVGAAAELLVDGQGEFVHLTEHGAISPTGNQTDGSSRPS